MNNELVPYAGKIVAMIEQARQNALQSVNAELIRLYWNVGEYLSAESAKSAWGDAFIDGVARYIKENCPGVKGFNRRGLYRMRQFFETYNGNEFVSPLVTQISWTNHLLNLKRAIVKNLKDFILEIGRDFTFIGEEYRVQVGNSDYYIDLLFYHRGLSCLVAFELKIDKFQPEYVGKMNFYLEALDRDHKKPNENPSIGVILCAGKEEEVVEFAMSRSLSPTMVADYSLRLIDKALLEMKLREFKGLYLNEEEH